MPKDDSKIETLWKALDELGGSVSNAATSRRKDRGYLGIGMHRDSEWEDSSSHPVASDAIWIHIWGEVKHSLMVAYDVRIMAGRPEAEDEIPEFKGPSVPEWTWELAKHVFAAVFILERPEHRVHDYCRKTEDGADIRQPSAKKIIEHPELSEEGREYLEYLTRWYRSKMSLPLDYEDWDGIEQVTPERKTAICTAMALQLAHFSEIEVALRVGCREQAESSWVLLCEYWPPAQELFERRYQKALSEA